MSKERMIRDEFYFEIIKCSSYSVKITLIVNILNFDTKLSDDTCLMTDLWELAIVRISCMWHLIKHSNHIKSIVISWSTKSTICLASALNSSPLIIPRYSPLTALGLIETIELVSELLVYWYDIHSIIQIETDHKNKQTIQSNIFFIAQIRIKAVQANFLVQQNEI